MDFDEILSWLMDGDVSIQFQTKRDLLGDNDIGLQNKIHKEGWGKQFLEKRKNEGHWEIISINPNGFLLTIPC